jgi:DnaJ-domain-containing protein 1
MKYLVTFATKGLDSAVCFSDYGGALNYLNDCIDAANIKIYDFVKYAPDCFKMTLVDGRDFDIKIELQADADVRFDLKIAKDKVIQETRRFVNREYAVNYAHKYIRSKGYIAASADDAEGFWAIEDKARGVDYDLGVGVAILGGSKNKDYEILGIKPDATEAEIKKAYREKVKENHPDRGGDPAKFESIQKAYERIKADQKPAKRLVKKYYDSRDMRVFFAEYGKNQAMEKQPQREFIVNIQSELAEARNQASTTAGSGAILLALGGAILLFVLADSGFHPLVLLAVIGIMGFGLFRLICGLYYQNKIEKLLKKYGG